MELIDDEGRLFGLVNVVDALVVLLVVAVVVAGFAFLDPLADEERTTRYATVDLGEHPQYVAEQVTEGDRMQPVDWYGNATVTDVYYTPAGDGNVSVTIRLALEGKLVESERRVGRVFRFAGSHASPGSTITLQTLEYALDGTVTTVATEGTDLPTGSTGVVVEGTVSREVAFAIDAGDAVAVEDARVATVESVAVYPTGEPANRRVVVGLSLATIDRGDERFFGGQRLRIGRGLALGLADYSLAGRITRTGATTPAGEMETVTAVVKLENVDREIADGLRARARERANGRTLATVVGVRIEPANVTLTSEGGDIFARKHPRRKDVYLTVELSVRRTDAGVEFHARPLQEGSTVVLDLGTVTVTGQVVDVESP